MRKFLLFLLIAVISLGVFAQDAPKKEASKANFGKFGISMSFPSGWTITKEDSTGIYLKSSSGIYFEYKKYLYNETGPKYNDYSVFSDDTTEALLKSVGDAMSDYYFDMDYDVNVTKSEIIKINKKTYLHTILDGIYWDYEYEDYDYNDSFEEDIYLVLNKGYVHSFIFSVDYEYFSDDEEKSNAQIISTVKFKK